MNAWTFAIDISHWWQVDWEQVPPEVRVVLVKASEGDAHTDPQFERHVEGALNSGRFAAPYHFYRTQQGSRKVPPVAQAEHFMRVTRPYWAHFKMRANDFEKGPGGDVYNPTLGSETNDLYEYQRALFNSEWKVNADLLYTSWGEWGDFKMMNWRNAWQGPQWLQEDPFGMRLWLAAWQENLPLPRYWPRPFKQVFIWQFSAGYCMPGISTTDGRPRPVDANWILRPPAEVEVLLGEGQAAQIPPPPDELGRLAGEVARLDAQQRSLAERVEKLEEWAQKTTY